MRGLRARPRARAWAPVTGPAPSAAAMAGIRASRLASSTRAPATARAALVSCASQDRVFDDPVGQVRPPPVEGGHRRQLGRVQPGPGPGEGVQGGRQLASSRGGGMHGDQGIDDSRSSPGAHTPGPSHGRIRTGVGVGGSERSTERADSVQPTGPTAQVFAARSSLSISGLL